MSTQQLDLYVANLDCEHDASVLQRGLQDTPGLTDLRVYPKAAKVALTYEPDQVTPDTLRATLRDLGFPPRQGLASDERPKLWRNPQILASAASGALLLAGWLMGLAGAPELVSTGIYIVATVTGAYFFGREAIEELVFERGIGIELLMLTAAVAATVMGQAAEGAMLAFLYSISEAAEGYTEEKTRSAIRALMDLTPKLALVKRGDQELEIPVEELAVGDIFIVKPGQSLPTDGEVVIGASSVNQAPVTGESVPVAKQPGDTVFAGSINGEGALEVRATKTFAENTIARIIQMVEEAQEQKGQSQRFIERFGSRYSPLVLIAGILLAVVPPLGFGADWLTWMTRATVFIVAAAPCALVISIPITLVASLGTGARQGVLIKGGVHVEELAKIRVVALDKTGTITIGEPSVTDVLLSEAGSSDRTRTREEVIAVAAGIERRSQHPLAQAIVRHARDQGIEAAEVTDFQSVTGAGALARVAGATVSVGSPVFFQSELGADLSAEQDVIARLQSEGKTVVAVGTERDVWGLLAISDPIRPNARRAIEALHAAGVQKVVMLTGDNERTAAAIARGVGIDEVYANLKPEDKALKVRELARQVGHVAMVGDGVNDAPALAEATIGVAMGAAGTDVAIETADVALMADDLEKLVYALRLAQRNQSVVRQNLALSVVVLTVLVVGAVAGVFTLPIAVLGHEISEFVVIASGLRMIRT